MTQNDVMHYDKPDEDQAYYSKIVDLLNHYEDGWNFLINAHKANDFDYALQLKPEYENDPYLPKSWLELTDAVIAIIAKDKYELDVYDNIIEIIRPDQMLDAYTTNGLPDAYRHWSFGKRRLTEEKKFDESKHLAYEIVINSNPCIAYCMDGNSPLMQALVIGHASYGHNSVFKNNYLFKNTTGADTVLDENKRIAEYVFECEQKYGYEEVSELLDCCHAMKFIDSSDTVARKSKPKAEREAQQRQKLVNQFVSAPHYSVFNTHAEDPAKDETPKGRPCRSAGEDNILKFMADNAPHMPEWKRNIMRMVSGVSQYFKPQMETKILNEGMATFTHDKIMTTLRDIGIINMGMYLEYNQINEGVLYQPPAVRQQRAEDGSIQEVLVGAEMNPYTLGLKILREIERICKEPTEEDKKWFPNFAGEKDWLSVVKKAVFSSTDETFIEQYLSPKAMRDLKMFMLEGLEDRDYYEITSVHADEGFKKIRTQLAKDQRLYEKLPQIRLQDYQVETDRCMVLRHQTVNNQLLNYKDARLVLELMHHQWGHPVVIESVDENGELVDYTTSIENYDHEDHKPLPAGLMDRSL